MQNLIYAAPAAGVLALVFAWFKASWVAKQDAGDANMVEIAGQIQGGALAFFARSTACSPSSCWSSPRS